MSDYGEEIESKLKCPHCKHLREIVYDHYEGMTGETTEGTDTCNKCQKDYDYRISIVWTFFGETKTQ